MTMQVKVDLQHSQHCLLGVSDYSFVSVSHISDFNAINSPIPNPIKIPNPQTYKDRC